MLLMLNVYPPNIHHLHITIIAVEELLRTFVSSMCSQIFKWEVCVV